MSCEWCVRKSGWSCWQRARNARSGNGSSRFLQSIRSGQPCLGILQTPHRFHTKRQLADLASRYRAAPITVVSTGSCNGRRAPVVEDLATPSQKPLPWRLRRYLQRWFPSVRICHPYPLQRLCVVTQGGSRNALVAPVRICGRGREQSRSLLQPGLKDKLDGVASSR